MEQDQFYIYNQKIHFLYETYVKETLIESFIEFYGIEYQEKIRNICNNLITVRLNHRATDELRRKKINQCQENLKQSTSKLSSMLSMNEESLRNLSDQQFQELVSSHLLSWNDVTYFKRSQFQADYYQNVISLHKQLPKESILLIGSDILEEGSLERKKIKKQELLYFIHSFKWSPTMGGLTCYLDTDFFLVFLFGYGICITTLIHEINHQLSREIIAILEEEPCRNIITHSISRQPNDYVYEILNEYMTMDIKTIFFEKWKQKDLQCYDYLFADKTRSVYLDVDASYGHVIQDFYHSAKNLIKNSLIQGEGNKIERIINTEFYQTLNKELSSIATQLKQSPPPDDAILEGKDWQVYEGSRKLLKTKLNEYHQYERELKKLYSKEKISH